MSTDKDFSFIILTYNEAVHLPRLLDSIKGLNARTFIVDSYSTDNTLEIAHSAACEVLQNVFDNHPSQWDFALKNCAVTTPWIIGLDADHIISDSLYRLLEEFADSDVPKNVNAVYYNRHNYFQGQRLKYGGYRNFYMLKMFRYNVGYSDLNENMDHRFVVPGQAVIWKSGILIEDNLKEYDIDFWIQKHIRYSTLVAHEELERIAGIRKNNRQAKLSGNINEQKLFLKNIWWKLPLFVRPHLYFFYRFFCRLGFLETRSGRVFHYLQSYWFRLLVDYKIYKKMKNGNT